MDVVVAVRTDAWAGKHEREADLTCPLWLCEHSIRLDAFDCVLY